MTITQNNGYFTNLNKYANEIMMALASSDIIAKLLTYTGDNVLSQPTPRNKGDLLYNNIFPYGYLPDVEKDIGTYITIEFDQFRSVSGKHFVSNYVVLTIFMHDRLQKINNGNRALVLYDEVHKVLEGRDLGVGKLGLNNGGVVKGLSRPYSGHYFAYELVDFNR